ncbi:MAG: acyl-CoA thioester hydrolase [Gammaproteobacteria bacterium]|jgi:acyl-CoA thioester hydrolase
MSEREPAPRRGEYPHFLPIQSRWMDNDRYGHVNNVIYYAWMDTVVNRFLIDSGGLDINQGAVIGVAAQNGCSYFSALAYPIEIDAGLRVARLGTSSVRYEVGIFGHGSDTAAAALYFVHVFVSRDTMRPAPIPEQIRAALVTIQI